MGTISQIASKYDEARAVKWGGDHPSAMSDAILAKFGYPPRGATASGVDVTTETALNYSAYFACIRVISETGGATPLPFYKRTAEGKSKDVRDPRYALFQREPNPEMTAYQFKEMGYGHMCTRGNFYAEIEWVGGMPKALWPLNPDGTKEARASDGTLFYITTLPSGQPHPLPARNVFHVPWFTFNGITGYSPTNLARDSIGSAIAANEFAGRFWSNDATPGGFLKTPKKLSDPAYDRLKAESESRRNLSNKHRMDILEEGLEWVQMSVTPEHAQFLETREFDINVLAQWFNIPPHKIQDLRRATYTNIEHQSIEFTRDTMRPWYARWEQQCNRTLLLPSAKAQYYWEYLIDDLLRGDIKTRFEAYSIGRMYGWLNVDEIRAKENMNSLPDGLGQEYMIPSNMQSAGALQNNPFNARSLLPILEDAIGRINARESRDGGKLDLDKHREFIHTVFAPYAETHRKLTGADFDIDEYANDRIKKLGG